MPPKTKTNPLSFPLIMSIIAWLFFVYLFVQIRMFSVEGPNDLLVSGMYFIEFGVHEASHLVVLFLPHIASAAAGSIGEVSFTLLILYATIKQKAYFTTIFAGLWVMLAMMSAGRYMADARSQLLPIIGPGENVIHDWNFVFGQLGWLQYDTFIGDTVSVIGQIIGVAVLVWGLWLIAKQVKSKNSLAT